MVRSIGCVIFLCLTSFFYIGDCKAEPDTTIKYLMKDYVSMLDWGILRWEEYLNNVFESIEPPKTSITLEYSWVANRIIVLGTIFLHDQKSKINNDYYKKICKERISFVKQISGGKDDKVDYFFMHNGFTKFTNNKLPDNLNEKIRVLADLKFTAIRLRGTVTEDLATCTSTLIGEDIFCK